MPVLIEVHFEIYSRYLLVHPFFYSYNEINPAGIRKVCHTAITMLSLHPKDVLFSGLEVPEFPRMFFIVSGTLRYTSGREVKTIGRGQWLCEHVLWTNTAHTGTAKADEETRIMQVDSKKLQELISSFPSVHASWYAEAFVERLKSGKGDPCDMHTDIGPNANTVRDMVDESFPQEEGSDDEEGSEDQEHSDIRKSDSLPQGRGSLKANRKDKKDKNGRRSYLSAAFVKRQTWSFAKSAGEVARGTRRLMTSVRGSIGPQRAVSAVLPYHDHDGIAQQDSMRSS